MSPSLVPVASAAPPRHRFSREPIKRLTQVLDEINERVEAAVPGFVREFVGPADGGGSSPIYFDAGSKEHSITVELSTCENPARDIARELRTFGEQLLTAATAIEAANLPGDDLEAACRVLLDEALECVCRVKIDYRGDFGIDDENRLRHLEADLKKRRSSCACHRFHLSCGKVAGLYRAEVRFKGGVQVARGSDVATCVKQFRNDVLPFVIGGAR